MKDLVIIGAAAAGSAAAIYSARRNLSFDIISKDIGGEVALCGEVQNWPGIIETDGITLANDFKKHVESYDVPIKDGIEVQKIEQKENFHIVHGKNANGEMIAIETKTVLIATGIHPKHMNIPGEEQYRGRGVTYCTVCDGPLFRNKTTITIGAGNSALESVLMLADLAKKAYIVTKFSDTKEQNGGFPRGENILIDKVKSHPNIEVVYNALTTEINGDSNRVNGITYTDSESKESRQVSGDGVMIHIGNVPNSYFVDCVEKNQNGEIIVDLAGKTSCPGVFAAGDVTTIPHKQIIIAAGQGATAALTAIEYINRWKPASQQ